MDLPKMDYVSTLIEHQNCTWCQLPCALRRAGYIKLPCFCFWVFSPCVRDVSSIKIRTFPPSGFLHRIQPKLILLGDAKSTLGPKNRNNLFKNMPITPGRTFGGCIISRQIPWREGVILLNSDMAKTGCFSRCFCTGRKGRSVARGGPGLSLFWTCNKVWAPAFVFWVTLSFLSSASYMHGPHLDSGLQM